MQDHCGDNSDSVLLLTMHENDNDGADRDDDNIEKSNFLLERSLQ